MCEGIKQLIEEGRNEGISIGRDEGISIGRDEGISIGRDEGISIGTNEGINTAFEIIRKLKLGITPAELIAQGTDESVVQEALTLL